MANWKTEIFDNDIGESIRTEYRNLLSAQLSDEEAERIILSAYLKDGLSNSIQESQVWIALAMRQWELGRLSDRVKERAVYWANQPSIGFSTETMTAFKETINLAMPKKKHIPLPAWVKKCPWPVGSLLAYRIISDNQGKVRSSPYWGKYVLLRIVKIVRHPITWLAPEAVCSESMLVGLYDWLGEEIPDPSIVDTLDFTPVVVTNPSLSLGSIPRVNPDVVQSLGAEKMTQLVDSIAMPRVETCCSLDWTCTNGIKQKEVFTYLGCDPQYQYIIPDYFKTEITDYSFCHSIPFDAMLYNRLQQMNDPSL